MINEKTIMKNLIPTTLLAATLLALLVTCCASPVKRTENMLTQSGFKAVPVKTPEQEQQLTSLPADRVSPVKRQGKVYFVFPDPAHKILYVGNKAQMHTFKQAVSDLRLEQDAKMEEAIIHAPEVNEDIDSQSGAMPSMEQIWEGWPD